MKERFFRTILLLGCLMLLLGIGCPGGWGRGAAAPMLGDGVANYDVRQFGVRGDGSSDDTAAIQAALDSGQRILYFPPGVYRIGNLTVPGWVRGFYGAGGATVFMPREERLTGHLLTFDALSDAYIGRFSLDCTGSPDLVAVALNVCENVRVEEVRLPDAGKIGIWGNDCQYCLVDRVTVSNWRQLGIYFQGESSLGNSVSHCLVQGSGTMHGIQMAGGKAHSVTHCRVEGAGIFGINLYQCRDGRISENVVYDTVREGINFEDVSQSIIHSNQVIWTDSTVSQDFGISVYGASQDRKYCRLISITDNQVTGSGKSGIVLAENVSGALVSGNVVKNVNRLNEVIGSGVLLYGAGCVDNQITNNVTIETEGIYLKYGIQEQNALGVPNNNLIAGNRSFGAVIAGVRPLGGRTTAKDNYVARILDKPGS